VDAKIGEVIAVPVYLVSGVPLRGVTAELAYSPRQFDVVEVAEGSFFKQGGGQTSFTQAVNAETGKIGVGILRSDTSGVAGEAPMLELKLRAKTAGDFEVKVPSLRLIGTGSAAVAPRLSSFLVKVQ